MPKIASFQIEVTKNNYPCLNQLWQTNPDGSVNGNLLFDYFGINHFQYMVDILGSGVDVINGWADKETAVDSETDYKAGDPTCCIYGAKAGSCAFPVWGCDPWPGYRADAKNIKTEVDDPNGFTLWKQDVLNKTQILIDFNANVLKTFSPNEVTPRIINVDSCDIGDSMFISIDDVFFQNTSKNPGCITCSVVQGGYETDGISLFKGGTMRPPSSITKKNLPYPGYKKGTPYLPSLNKTCNSDDTKEICVQGGCKKGEKATVGYNNDACPGGVW